MKLVTIPSAQQLIHSSERYALTIIMLSITHIAGPATKVTCDKFQNTDYTEAPSQLKSVRIILRPIFVQVFLPYRSHVNFGSKILKIEITTLLMISC